MHAVHWVTRGAHTQDCAEPQPRYNKKQKQPSRASRKPSFRGRTAVQRPQSAESTQQ
jgi:hypothetical protein